MYNKLAIINIACGSIMISFSSVFVSLSSVSPIALAAYRMLFAGIILLLWTLARRDTLWVNRQGFFYNLLAGIFFAGDLCFWHSSIRLIGPGLATILVNLQVFILTFIGIVIYREKTSLQLLLSIPLVLLGVGLLVGYNWVNSPAHYKLGVFEALTAALFYSGYILILKKSQVANKKTLPPISNLAILSLLTSLILIVVGKIQHQSFVIPNALNWLWVISYAIIAQCIGWALISKGISKVTIVVASFLVLLQPALSFVWDIVIFHRVTPPTEIMGALITLFAILLCSLKPEQSTD